MGCITKHYLNEYSILGVWKIEEDLDTLLGMVSLDNEEKKRYKGFSSNSRKLEFLSVRALLSELTGKEASIVYNNFPFPENPTDKQIQLIEEKAKKILDTRSEFPNNSLAELYDQLSMPQALVKAHNELDKAVDLAYRPQPFTSEANRMVYLFELYEKYTADLFSKEKKKVIKMKRKDEEK